MKKERWLDVGRREGRVSLTHTGRKYRKCPIGKTSSGVIVNPGLIYCLGGHESKVLILCVSLCVRACVYSCFK